MAYTLNKKLELFVAVAEAGSFSKAAENSFTSQSALSQQIGALEKELNLPLFERHPRGVRLTKAGESLFGDVKGLLEDMDQALAKARAIQEAAPQKLTIGVSLSSCNYICSQVCPHFQELHPEIGISIREFPTGSTLDSIFADGFDILETPLLGCIASTRYSFHAYCTDRVQLCVPPGHRLANMGLISPQDLEGETILLYPSGLLPDCDQFRDYLYKYVRKFTIVESGSPMNATECILKGWVFPSLEKNSARYTPMISVKLAWKLSVDIGLVTKEAPGAAVQSFLRDARMLVRQDAAEG